MSLTDFERARAVAEAALERGAPLDAAALATTVQAYLPFIRPEDHAFALRDALWLMDASGALAQQSVLAPLLAEAIAVRIKANGTAGASAAADRRALRGETETLLNTLHDLSVGETNPATYTFDCAPDERPERCLIATFAR
ncbi:MAG: hypothetical protein AAGF60_04625 [Pseudomonadota bacterium]